MKTPSKANLRPVWSIVILGASMQMAGPHLMRAALFCDPEKSFSEIVFDQKGKTEL